MKKLKDLTKIQSILVLGLLLLITGTLFYIISIKGDYVVVYAAKLPFVDECTETYENYKLVSEPCPQSIKINEDKYNLGQYYKYNLDDE